MTTPLTPQDNEVLEWYGFHQLDCRKKHNPDSVRRWLQYNNDLEERSERFSRRVEEVDSAQMYIQEKLRENDAAAIPLHIRRLSSALYANHPRSGKKHDSPEASLAALVEDMREQVILHLLAGAEKAAKAHNPDYAALWNQAADVAALKIPGHFSDRTYDWVGQAYKKLRQEYKDAHLRAVA
jgi:hypothetical protein